MNWWLVVWFYSGSYSTHSSQSILSYINFVEKFAIYASDSWFDGVFCKITLFLEKQAIEGGTFTMKTTTERETNRTTAAEVMRITTQLYLADSIQNIFVAIKTKTYLVQPKNVPLLCWKQWEKWIVGWIDFRLFNWKKMCGPFLLMPAHFDSFWLIPTHSGSFRLHTSRFDS